MFFIEKFILTTSLNLATKMLSKKIEDKVNKERIKLEIQTFLDKKCGKFSDEKYDINFERLTELFWDDNLELVNSSIVGTCTERSEARDKLYLMAIEAAGTESNQGKRLIRRVVGEIIEATKHCYRQMAPITVKSIVNDAVEDVNAHVDECMEKAINKIKEGDDLVNPNVMKEIVQSKDSKRLEEELDYLKNSIGPAHKLYPDYIAEIGMDGKLISKPQTADALRKYPPTFKLKGVVTVGDTVFPELNEDVVNYSYRHQMNISFKITDATKLLGDILDPFQSEAESMIGTVLIKEPKKFNPAQPFCIKVGEVTYYEYIELGLEEILDDGTLIISNHEQENVSISFTILLNEDRTPDFKVHYSGKTNQDYYLFVKFVNAINEGEMFCLYSLKDQKNLLEGKGRGICSDDEREKLLFDLDVFETICNVENGFEMEFPNIKGLNVGDYNKLKYLSDLITKGRAEIVTDSVELNLVLHEKSPESFAELEDVESCFAIDVTNNVEIMDMEFNIQIRRVFEKAKLEKLDKIKKIVALSDIGDSVKISINVLDGKCYDLITPESLMQ